jgi:RHS repeat-associated protein
MVTTHLQAGYMLSAKGEMFTSPFFLLAAWVVPIKSHRAKKSEGNKCVTGVPAVSETRIKGWAGYGCEVAEDAPKNDFRYVGEQWDPNAGFYYLRARWMDPGVGRFASVDPFKGMAIDPNTLHRYLYSKSDPVNNSDPTGMLYNLTSVSTALTIRNVLYNASLAIGAVYSVQSILESREDALAVDLGPAPSGDEQPGLAAMRIQFQTTKGGKTKTHSRADFNAMDYGVTKLQALTMLHNLRWSLPSWWIGRLGAWTKLHVESIEGKIMKSKGVGPGFEYFYREKTNIGGANYRIDMESLRGLNLMHLH